MNKSHFYLWIYFLPFMSILLVFDSFLNIGGVQFAHIWKVLFIIFGLFVVSVQKKIFMWQFWMFILVFKMVAFNAKLQFFTMAQILEAARFLMLPLFFSVLLFFNYTNSKNLNSLANLLSKLAIILCMPFAFQVVDSPYDRINEFGFESLIGVFHTYHSASFTLATCTLILFSSFRSRANSIDFIFGLLGFYLVYLTFVRTGLALLVLGIIYIYMPRKINFRSFIEVSIVIVSICSVALIVMQDQIFYARFLDISPSGVQRDFGSGRLVFYLVSIDLLSNMSLFEALFGIGRSSQMDFMYLSTGMSITSHNGFLDLLIQHGLIGLILFVVFFRALWSAIQPSDNDRLIKGLFFMILGFQFVQGGFMFYFDFLFAILLLAQKKSQSFMPIKSLEYSK